VCVCVKERERERRVAFHSVSWFRIAAWPVCVNYVNGDLFSAFVCQSLGTTTKKWNVGSKKRQHRLRLPFTSTLQIIQSFFSLSLYSEVVYEWRHSRRVRGIKGIVTTILYSLSTKNVDDFFPLGLIHTKHFDAQYWD